MNRSTFFKTLGIGLVTAPAIAKVLAEEPRTREPSPFDGDIHAVKQQWLDDCWKQIAKHIAETDPYAGLMLSPDHNPLRFNA